MPKSEAEKNELLAKLKLPAKGASLGALDEPALDLPTRPEADPTAKKRRKIKLAPKGMDPHTMPIKDIVFDPHLLDDFPDLKGQQKAASDYVFALYRSPGKDPDRHGLLHRRISDFIRAVRRERADKSGKGFVRDKIKANRDHEETADFLAERGISKEQLSDPDFLESLAKALRESKGGE